MDLSFFSRGYGNARLLANLVQSRGAKNRDISQRLLAERMGALRGLPQKLGQTLSMMQTVPLEGGFEKLHESGSAMPLSQFELCLEEAWGAPWQQFLRELDPKPHAASIGQVHRGICKDGRELAIKVAYPGIRQAVLQDLKMLGWVGQSSSTFLGFDWTSIRDMLLADLKEELDYRLELKNQQQYKTLAPQHLAVVVPGVISQLSGEHVLVTHWEAGQSLKETLHWPKPFRLRLARLFLEHTLFMLFVHGKVHADPHPGNYRFRMGEQPSMVLYDFGSVATFSKRQRLLLLKLMRDTLDQCNDDPFETLVALGFRADFLMPLRDKLPAICRVLFEPFLTQSAFDMDDWQRGEKLNHILGDKRWNFRFAGPPDVMFLVRMFQGMMFYLHQWRVQLPWQPYLRRLIRHHQTELDQLNVPTIEGERTTFLNLAKFVHIKLTQQGQTRVKLSFPLGALDRLDQLMGADIAARVQEAGINVPALVKRARSNGLQPQALFTWQGEAGKVINVWLE